MEITTNTPNNPTPTVGPFQGDPRTKAGARVQVVNPTTGAVIAEYAHVIPAPRYSTGSKVWVRFDGTPNPISYPTPEWLVVR